jgi:ribosomal protein S1
MCGKIGSHMEKLSVKYNLPDPLNLGDIVKGKVFAKEGSRVFVDLGPQGVGFIQRREFQEVKSRMRDLEPGKQIFVKVIDLKTDEGYIELSLKDAQKKAIWQELEEKKEKKEVLKIKILGANKGGLVANVSGVSAFLPSSQLSVENYPKVERGDPEKISKELQKFVGKELEVNIFSLDPQQNQIIISEKLRETERKKQTLKNCEIGDVVEGEITGICDFGAFVRFSLSDATTIGKSEDDPALLKEINGKQVKENKQRKQEFLEGLIHVSEFEWQLVEKVEEVVKIGEKVKVKILQIRDDKVFLSLKRLKENPWQDIEKTLKKGENVKGKVKKFSPHGAFVEVLPKIQGLCHISEFGSQEKMEKQLEIGKTYDFKILMVDPEEYKIALQLTKEQK